MNHFVRNILAVIGGFVLGSVVNMGIITMSGSVIPPPEGADVTTMKGLQAALHLFEPRHFIMPFLAHALGTFVGAFFAAWMAKKHKMKVAFAIGGLFLLGGVANALLLPAPIWFIVVDLTLAYIPMAYLGGMLGRGHLTSQAAIPAGH